MVSNLFITKPVIQTIIIFLLCFYFGCSSDNEIIQYLAFQDGEKLRPYAKVIYRVSVDRQEVVYWIEVPGKDRSQLYKLEKCIVADMNNWEGEADYILLWKIRVEVINGHFTSPGEALVNVDWVRWHFKTDPSPSHLSGIVTSLVIAFVALGIIIIVITTLREWRAKRQEKIAERWSRKTRE